MPAPIIVPVVPNITLLPPVVILPAVNVSFLSTARFELNVTQFELFIVTFNPVRVPSKSAVFAAVPLSTKQSTTVIVVAI